jgi:hypothetical protein
VTLRCLTANRRGSITVIAALSLLGVVGATGLAIDLNRGYEQRIRNQRVADMAALAAAMAYKANGSETILRPTALDLVTIHGMANATINVELLADTPTAGSKAVRVSISTPLSLSLTRIFGATTSVPVGASALARLGGASTTTPCIMGLASSGNAIETQGGASINATDCAITAVGSVNNGGNSITAKKIVSGAGDIINSWGKIVADSVQYAGSLSYPSYNEGNVPAASKRTKQASTVSDPLENNMDLIAARQLLGNYRSPRAIANPVTPACSTAWTFGWSPSSNVTAYRTSDANFIVPAGNYCLKSLSITGGSVTFQPGSTVTVSNGLIVSGGASATFGSGTYRINGGFNTGSSGVTFGDGELSIGSGTTSFAGTTRIGNGPVTIAGNISLGGGTKVTMGAGDHAFKGITIGGGGWMWLGDGNLDVDGPIKIDGDSTLIAGQGDYTLANAGGDAINLSGSARFFMDDGQFSANGNIITAGGSRLVFGRTANHLIKGNMTIAGSVLFGAGRYTISGGFTNGTGGTTWPYTSPINNRTWGTTLEGVSVSGFDMAGVSVSFIMGGTLNLSGGAQTKLIAPLTTTSGGALADILMDSLTTADTNWGAGAQSTFVGVVHLPKSYVKMSGGNNTLSSGQCFTLIASRVLASGGATAGTACKSISDFYGANGGSVELVG